jgi:uncharacterized sporulation protein YeaH/YhbH (DUF444 family)
MRGSKGMSGFVIDRREEHRNKSPTSRDRFIKRYKDIIKQAAADQVKQAKGFRDLTTGAEGTERKIVIDRKSLDEPQFIHGQGGTHEHIFGDNDIFTVGDKVNRPTGGGGQGGSEGSPDGEGEDSFVFYLDREEFLRLILDDLALPDMVKKNLTLSLISELVHAGFTKQGSPGNMDVQRSFKMSLSRRIGLHRNEKKARLLELEAELEALRKNTDQPGVSGVIFADEEKALVEQITALQNKLRSMPFFDTNNDLRFRHRELERKPSVQAVMFCLMDVSGSMTENMKEHAKYFFMLLHLFLQKNYSNVAVVFVRHTSTAQEVDEQTFFYDRETGGTVVSSGLQLVYDIIKERFDPTVWNIYIAQASDGDNYGADSTRCMEILQDKLLPMSQYMVYVEMSDNSLTEYRSMGFAKNSESDLWRTYASVAAKNENLAMKTVGGKQDIYPVFRQLFEKKHAEHA